jgi:Ser/Thr protein kinase RdoA (MazF antagonist)
MHRAPTGADLREILAGFPAEARPLMAPEALGNAGGASGARLWRFASGRGTLVARAWPPDGPGREVLEQIHAWLAEAGGLGFVPVPVPGLDGRTVRHRGGRFWELAPWRPGIADGDRPPAPARLRAGVSALAAFHQSLARPRVHGPSPGLARRGREIDALRGGGFDTLGRVLEGASAADPGREPARRWLALARRLAPAIGAEVDREAGRIVALQPCLRDARPEHFLFEGRRLTGLVDFGAMAVDSVAGDLARLLAEWTGTDRTARAAALACYAAVRPLEEAEVALIGPFERSAALLGAGRWVLWHFVQGRTFDDPSAVSRGLRRGLERLTALAAGSLPG